MNRNAIVLVTTSFPISSDGSEAAGSFVSDFAEALSERVQVRVVAPGRADGLEAWSEGVEVFRYAAPSRPLSTLKAWHPLDVLKVLRVLRSGKQATKRAIEAGSTAHVFALWALPSGVWARSAVRNRGIGYSVWMLGSDVWSLGRIPLLRGLLARVIRGASKAWADGYQLAADAEKIAGVKVEFLPSSRRITLENAPPPRAQAPYRLLFLGRWHPNKGIDLLLDAVEQLTDDDWGRIEVVEIHGGGPMETLVRKRVSELQKAGRPIFAGGFLAKAEAEAAIARADWILIPSRIESIPVIFSDAMKLGRPVVAMPVGDLPRLLGEARCGLLAEAASSEMLVAALRRALCISPQSISDGFESMTPRFDLERIVQHVLPNMVSQ